MSAGVLVARQLAATGIYLEDGSAPVLNVAHQFPSGAINLSAGANPSQGFNVTPVASGNTQVFSGPNITVGNVLSVPNQFNVGTANIATALNVTGPSTLAGQISVTGNLSVFGGANVVNSLTVGNTVSVPTVLANSITVSGAASNIYVQTQSSLSSNSSALYLSPSWRIKAISSGGLAFQSLLGGSWVNSSVVAPSGIAISILNLTSPTI